MEWTNGVAVAGVTYQPQMNADQRGFGKRRFEIGISEGLSTMTGPRPSPGAAASMRERISIAAIGADTLRPGRPRSGIQAPGRKEAQ